ncbi:MAG: phospholipase D-like domain-containing protein [Candidatus Polarisedimenticolaceae bacterium]|nr:phospholipase D-like domain-containing protein [Candidatus Polarisedimenticolaceae bacterium]
MNDREGLCPCNPLSKRETGARHDAIQLYTEGDHLFEAMLEAIDSAQKQVWMETYIFADDEVGRRFARALSERARAGVQVRLLVDALGSLFQFYRSLGPELEQSGVQVHHFHRWQWREPLRYNRRDHRKLLVIDGKTAFLGGFNIHRQSSQRYYGAARWRDTHAAFKGDLAQQAAELFDAFWRGDKKWLPNDHELAESVLIPNQSRACRRRLACIYTDFLGSAKHQVCLTTPYFVPDHHTQKVLLAAVKRGVEVRLLVPQTSDVRLAGWAANAVYARLLDAGVKIFEYLPRMLHAKVAIADGKWATLGTANLDYRSLLQNYELNLVSRNPELCRQLQLQFEADLTEASAVCAIRWRQRRWVPRLAELLGWSVRRWL